MLVTDNGTQFTSTAFSGFEEWQFEHQTSSPYYPHSNGCAENVVKTCKNLMKKEKADGQDPLLALLDWRNTPTEGIETSPVQRLMGCRTQNLLPTHENLLIHPSHKGTAAKQVKTSAPVQQEVSPIRTFEMWKDYPDETSWEVGMGPGDLQQNSEE